MASSSRTEIPNIPQSWRSFICEYNPESKMGRMPSLFSNDFYDTVPEIVVLSDPFDNKFEILVHKQHGRVYLLDCWEVIGKRYNLREGGWIILHYLRESEFMMTVQHLCMEDVIYPLPARTFKLGLPSSPINVSDGEEDAVAEFNVRRAMMEEANHDCFIMGSGYGRFYMEYNPLMVYGKIPAVFSKFFGEQVAKHVMLSDPFKNRIELKVSKKGNRLKFKDGWTKVGDLYNLHSGGWLRIMYVGPTEFKIEVLERTLKDHVLYPLPPQTYLICGVTIPVDIELFGHPAGMNEMPQGVTDFTVTQPEDVCDVSADPVRESLGTDEEGVPPDEDPVHHQQNDHTDDENAVADDGEGVAQDTDAAEDNQFDFFWEKTLSDYQSKCYSLPLKGDFVSVAFPNKRKRCNLTDEEGTNWPCQLRWTGRTEKECFLTCGWKKFATAKSLKEGSVIGFGVSGNDETQMSVVILRK